jgi:FdhD protein
MPTEDRGGTGGAVREVEALRVSADGASSARVRDALLVEGLLTIEVEGVGRYVIACCPEAPEALAAGFARSEGLIDGREDIVRLERRGGDPSVVDLAVRDPGRLTPGRNLLVTSSCGACGVRNLEPFLAGLAGCGRTLIVPGAVLLAAMRSMRDRQRLFARTGGAHAAALVGPDGSVRSFAEDIGRHNALDKAIGSLVLQGADTRGLAALLSGRVSWELAAKAARAGIELVAAVSAPSSLAVTVAERCGVTLCGFVREDRLTVYTHPGRVMPGSAG